MLSEQQKIKRFFLILLTVIFCQCHAFFAADKTESIYFYAGKIVKTEILKSSPDIVNVSPYEPPADINGKAAYASLTVIPDKGRSLGIYDYVLKTADGIVCPCIAIAEGRGAFDAGTWRVLTTSPKKCYSLLFRLPSPSAGNHKINLHFNYDLPHIRDIPLNFTGTHMPLPENHTVAKKSKKSKKSKKGKKDKSQKSAETLDSGKNSNSHPDIVVCDKLGTWNGSKLSLQWKPHTWKLPSKFFDKGFVGVHFEYAKGGAALEIKQVQLFINGKKVAQDIHPGFTGKNNKDNTYFLDTSKLSGTISRAFVKAMIRGAGSTDSSGKVYWVKKK